MVNIKTVILSSEGHSVVVVRTSPEGISLAAGRIRSTRMTLYSVNKLNISYEGNSLFTAMDLYSMNRLDIYYI